MGTELTYRVNQPIPVTQHFPGVPAFFKDESQETELTALVRPLPFSTETTKPVTPSDLITLVYIGSEDSIKKAFDAAGWVPADPLSTESKYGVMRPIIENQGYREGPVSTLLLNGQAPTLVFSKTLDYPLRPPPPPHLLAARHLRRRADLFLHRAARLGNRHQQKSQVNDPSD